MTDFFRTRWRGETPLDRLFWRDMLLVGTILNIASSALALILLGLKLPLWLVLAVQSHPSRSSSPGFRASTGTNLPLDSHRTRSSLPRDRRDTRHPTAHLPIDGSLGTVARTDSILA